MLSQNEPADTFDQIFAGVLEKLVEKPDYVCSPRGQKIHEVLATTLVLRDPRARLLTCKSRETNYGFGVGEFLWYWTGKQDLQTMLYYNKRMKDFSDDGETLNSAYGYRMKVEGRDPLNLDRHDGQWGTAVRELVRDPDSRRAVILINRAEDQFRAEAKGSKDVPCTLSLQFFVREDPKTKTPRLHLHTHMRSNDVMWGLTYDLFSFTLFQECMLLELKEWKKFENLELGQYYHTAGSLHLYERHFEQAKEILKEYSQWNTSADGICSPHMKSLPSLGHLQSICEFEQVIRTGSFPKGSLIRGPTTEGTWTDWMMAQLIAQKEKRDAGK